MARALPSDSTRDHTYHNPEYIFIYTIKRVKVIIEKAKAKRLVSALTLSILKEYTSLPIRRGGTDKEMKIKISEYI